MNRSKTWEIVIILITLIPFIVLGIIYPLLPDQVAVHFDANLQPDRYGSKLELWIIPILLNGLLYFLFKYIPKLDPKNQIEKMGKKWLYFRTGVTICLTALSCSIIYATMNVTNGVLSNNFLKINPQWIYSVVGILFVVIGNYLPATKPNYFVGIRTPWTLENDLVWRKTHRLGGKLFVASGLLVIVASLLGSQGATFWVLITTVVILTLITFIYSYQLFKKLSNE